MGEYKCLSVFVNVKRRFVAHKFLTGWEVGVGKSVSKKKIVAGQFAVKFNSETYVCTAGLKN